LLGQETRAIDIGLGEICPNVRFLAWPPQSPDLNPIEMVWDELAECRKSSQQVLSICGNSFKTVGKAFQVKLVERFPRVSSRQRVPTLKNPK
jgi:hypothetical protein